jgi:hypothetical protein
MRSRAAAVLAPLREWLLLERAQTTVRLYTPAQHALVAAHTRAAERRIRAARAAADALAAATLLRLGILHLLLAKEAAVDPSLDESALAAREPWAALPELPPPPDRPNAPADTERVRTAIATADPLYFDRLSPEALESIRAALERAASHLRTQVEPRTLANVRGTRGGRLAAIGVLFAYVVFRVVANTFFPTNVALNKPVTPSSYKHNPPDGHELVDGQPISSFGIHTNIEDSPRVTIDLLRPYTITSVKVYNRGDGWFDDSLPLVVELSADGQNYYPIGRRETHFDQDPPWVIDAQKHRARYVRLRVDRRSYLALSEVEVFGKK